jgi:hypothetical protein
MAGKKAKAHHEAGHAVVARVLGIGIEHAVLAKNDAPFDSNVLRYSAAYQGRHDQAARHAGLEKDVKVSLAGPIAQHTYRPLSPAAQSRAADAGWESDYKEALGGIIRIVYEQGGGDWSNVTNELLEQFRTRAETRTLLDRLSRETEELVQNNWPAIQRVATALLDRRLLYQNDIDALIAS